MKVLARGHHTKSKNRLAKSLVSNPGVLRTSSAKPAVVENKNNTTRQALKLRNQDVLVQELLIWGSN